MRLTCLISWSALAFATSIAVHDASAQELGDPPAQVEVAAAPDAVAPDAVREEVFAAADPAEPPLPVADEPPAALPVTAQLVQPADAPKPTAKDADLEAGDIEEYDPWQPFNEEMFEFNRKLDRYVLKPVAKAYDKVVPDQVQRSIRNAFDNIGSVRRVVNSLVQGRFETAGQEFGRFVFNTIFGIGGLFDVAKSELGIESKSIDAGQTFGVYGAPPGPYLIVPLFPPFTVREAVGYVVDSFLNPLRYIGMDFFVSVAVEAGKTVNERSLNLEEFDELEKGVFDLYSAVRNGYLQRRQRMIEDGRAESVFFRDAKTGNAKKDR